MDEENLCRMQNSEPKAVRAVKFQRLDPKEFRRERSQRFFGIKITETVKK